MSFASNFNPRSEKDANRDIQHYLTSSGNQCERYQYTGLKIPDHSMIRARSIKSFFEEIRAGDELVEYTPLHYENGESNILYRNTRTFGTSQGYVSIQSISIEDAKEFAMHNNNTLQGITISSAINRSLEGCILIIQDPFIKELELLNNSSNTWKLISKGVFLEKIQLASITFLNNMQTCNLSRLDFLKILTISSVTLNSKVAEMNFFRNLKLLPNLNKFSYTHFHAFNNNKINFKCALQTDYSYTNASKLLNLWKPKSEVDCYLSLSGRFTKVFCRYALSKVFSPMKELNELAMFWDFFGTNEHFASKEVKIKNLSKPPRLRNPLGGFLGAARTNLNVNNIAPHAGNRGRNQNALLNVFPRPTNINILVPPPAPLQRRIGIRRRFPSSDSSSSSSEFHDPYVEGNNFFNHE